MVAQGNEAGGHTGGTGTLSLLQTVLKLARPYDVPVLAAGGIASGTALAAVLAGGAAGAWMGTRFYVTSESRADPEAKRRIREADGESTVYTRVFDVASRQPWPAHLAGRALRNQFTEAWHGREADLAAAQPRPGALLADGKARVDYDIAPVWAGQAAALIDDEPTAGQVLRDLVHEAEHALLGAAATVRSPRSNCQNVPTA
ncbi:MAG TPA: nitronate monooxygenase [Acidimicrobiales bacterium]|nr:nitronate monooxygenase [Acidimicrobiales bacterium]